MKQLRIPAALTMFAGVALGSCVAVFVCLSLGRRDSDSASVPSAKTESSRETPVIQPSELRESLTKFDGLPARERLLISAESRGLDGESRAELLDQVMELSVADRKSILAVLVLQWAALDPEAANLWCRDTLSGEERGRILADLITIWSREDAMAAAQWWAKEMPIDDITHVGLKVGFRAIAESDPIAYATYFDTPPLKGYFWLTGFYGEDMLQDPADIERFATAVIGNIGYTSDSDPLSSGRSTAGKCGWNELFELVAMEKYQRDPPPSFEGWLGQFSENAQNVIREKIKSWNQHAAREAAAAAAPPAEMETPALVRDDPDFVPATENFARAQKEWAEWWRSDRPAAEAFFEASKWPEELKFRARATAYTQAPDNLRRVNTRPFFLR